MRWPNQIEIWIIMRRQHQKAALTGARDRNEMVRRPGTRWTRQMSATSRASARKPARMARRRRSGGATCGRRSRAPRWWKSAQRPARSPGCLHRRPTRAGSPPRWGFSRGASLGESGRVTCIAAECTAAGGLAWLFNYTRGACGGSVMGGFNGRRENLDYVIRPASWQLRSKRHTAMCLICTRPSAT